MNTVREFGGRNLLNKLQHRQKYVATFVAIYQKPKVFDNVAPRSAFDWEHDGQIVASQTLPLTRHTRLLNLR